MTLDWQDHTVLITGGTGSFGHKFVETLLAAHRPRKLIIFSRDELKQYEMRQRFPDGAGSVVRYFIGDVRDRDRLYRAFDGVDIIVHAAALKQVPAAEYNPLEFIKTNVLGAANVIDAAIDRNVKRVIALSTDKAANPINLYGATKLCSDKLFIAANSYSGPHQTRFCVVRYGNVIGSRGSVVPYFLKMRKSGVLPITDPRMTRFWITLEKGVDFVVSCLGLMQGGEVFVSKIPSMNIMDLARAVAPECQTKIVGIRPGEKLHEQMIGFEDARNTYEYKDHYRIMPAIHHWSPGPAESPDPDRLVPPDFTYCSDNNPDWMTSDILAAWIEKNRDKIGKI